MGHAIYEWVYLAVVTGILIWIGAESWVVEKHIDEIPQSAETIKVIAQQWFWTFEHQDGTKEVGELHLKVGKAYRFEVTSKDVIHAFNVPYYTAMIDAVPGRVNKVWFAPDTPGEFLIQCREYCGLLHNQMRAKLIVEA
ncbi:MAG: hypothetical protein ACRD32_06915 [Nitrososphaerales archaeon]